MRSKRGRETQKEQPQPIIYSIAQEEKSNDISIRLTNRSGIKNAQQEHSYHSQTLVTGGRDLGHGRDPPKNNTIIDRNQMGTSSPKAKMRNSPSYHRAKMKDGYNKLQHATQAHRFSKAQEGIIPDGDDKLDDLRTEVMLKYGLPSIKKNASSDNSQQSTSNRDPSGIGAKKRIDILPDSLDSQISEGKPELVKISKMNTLDSTAVLRQLPQVSLQSNNKLFHQKDRMLSNSSIPNIPLGMPESLSNGYNNLGHRSISQTSNSNKQPKTYSSQASLQTHHLVTQPQTQHTSPIVQPQAPLATTSTASPKLAKHKKLSTYKSNKKSKASSKHNRENHPENSSYSDKIIVADSNQFVNLTIMLERKRIEYVNIDSQEPDNAIKFITQALTLYIEDLLHQKLLVSKTGHKLTLDQLIEALKDSIKRIKDDPKNSYSENDFTTLSTQTENALIPVFHTFNAEKDITDGFDSQSYSGLSGNAIIPMGKDRDTQSIHNLGIPAGRNKNRSGNKVFDNASISGPISYVNNTLKNSSIEVNGHLFSQNTGNLAFISNLRRTVCENCKETIKTHDQVRSCKNCKLAVCKTCIDEEIEAYKRNELNSNQLQNNELSYKPSNMLKEPCPGPKLIKLKCLYGIKLLDLVHDVDKDPIPAVVNKMIYQIQWKKLHQTEGFYRKGPATTKKKEFKNILNKDPLLKKIDWPYWTNHPHVISSCFKEFFRELPEPLLGYNNYYAIINCGKKYLTTDKKIAGTHQLDISDEQKQIYLKNLIPIFNSMRSPNKEIWNKLIYHLACCCQESDFNRMKPYGLATIWMPCLLKAEPGMESMKEFTINLEHGTYAIQAAIEQQMDQLNAHKKGTEEIHKRRRSTISKRRSQGKADNMHERRAKVSRDNSNNSGKSVIIRPNLNGSHLVSTSVTINESSKHNAKPTNLKSSKNLLSPDNHHEHLKVKKSSSSFSSQDREQLQLNEMEKTLLDMTEGLKSPNIGRQHHHTHQQQVHHDRSNFDIHKIQKTGIVIDSDIQLKQTSSPNNINPSTFSTQTHLHPLVAMSSLPAAVTITSSRKEKSKYERFGIRAPFRGKGHNKQTKEDKENKKMGVRDKSTTGPSGDGQYISNTSYTHGHEGLKGKKSYPNKDNFEQILGVI